MVTLPQPCGPSALWTWSWAFPDRNVAVEALGGFLTALVPFRSSAIISGDILPWLQGPVNLGSHAWNPGCEDPGEGA